MGNICWIASYPKSGNTWVRAFIANYLDGGTTPVDINTLHERSVAEARAERYRPYVAGGDTTRAGIADLCAIRSMVHADIARQAPGTVFVKTHNFMGAYQDFPLHNMAVTSGAVYVVRNPMDVAVSLANYFAFTIDQAIDFMAEEMTGTRSEAENVPQVINSWSVHVASWTGQDNPAVLVLRYEDLLDKPLKFFRKLVAFLGQPRDDARLRRAVACSSFGSLQSQERAGGFVERHEDARRFFRAGRKNQWRDALDAGQVRRIVADHGQQMARFRYLPPGLR